MFRCVFVSLFLCCFQFLPAQSSLPLVEGKDWLIHPFNETSAFHEEGQTLIASNGLFERTFQLSPNLATIGLKHLATQEEFVRAVKPEAKLQLNGAWYDVGGLKGQPNLAYLTSEWLHQMTTDSMAFQFSHYEMAPLKAHIAWKQVRYAGNTAWPPAGKELRFYYHPPKQVTTLQGLTVIIHYQFYDGLPLLSKWLTIQNNSSQKVVLNRFMSEVLGFVEPESAVELAGEWRKPHLYALTDYAFHGMSAKAANQTVYWEADPTYLTQVNYQRVMPAVMEIKPPIGPDAHLEIGETFESFRAYELLLDSDDRERQGLSIRKMLRTIAPWITENPVFMHVRQADSASVREAIDQCAEVGFEMVILTFGSGFNMEHTSPDYMQQIKADVDYAQSKGIELGGYSLLASRRISDEHDVVSPETGKTGNAIFGNSPCLGSTWGASYFDKISTFLETTGLSILEHDGNYPGDVCMATHHPNHRGLLDSQWMQWKKITGFYAWAREQGIYLNVPDYYFLNGSNKTGMGYRETNWSLPRNQQIIHARQNIFDGTWEKTSSMGWMFVPLVEYHGGGETATLEPLSEHLDAYEAHLANLFGAGVMATYRGPRLYDTPETKAVVKKWVSFYKKYRTILDSDIIHIRRADGKSWDALLHVNPQNKEKGLLMVYNPTNLPIATTITLPLYYTGLSETANIREQEGMPQTFSLARDFTIQLPVTVPAQGNTWFVIE